MDDLRRSHEVAQLGMDMVYEKLDFVCELCCIESLPDRKIIYCMLFGLPVAIVEKCSRKDDQSYEENLLPDLKTG